MYDGDRKVIGDGNVYEGTDIYDSNEDVQNGD